MQGTDDSGSLGGPDVRRQIPIKLLSKQAVRSKPTVRPQRSTGRLFPKGPSGDEGKSNMIITVPVVSVGQITLLLCTATPHNIL